MKYFSSGATLEGLLFFMSRSLPYRESNKLDKMTLSPGQISLEVYLFSILKRGRVLHVDSCQYFGCHDTNLDNSKARASCALK